MAHELEKKRDCEDSVIEIEHCTPAQAALSFIIDTARLTYTVA